MEEQLSDMDEFDFHNGDGTRLMSRNSDLMQAKRDKTKSVRAGLINDIRAKLVNYGTYRNGIRGTLNLRYNRRNSLKSS